MAIQFFKDIIKTKGYRIDSKDRKIFETGDLQSFFGLSDSDAIEFVLYDANETQLPQGNYGMVRYITLTTQTISDYFLVADGTLFQAHKFPTEYFIDAERLIKEAGYDMGIFKTQVTLINKRLGDETEHQKVWISEISPSRTEIRIFPLVNKNTVGTDLFERYNIFLTDGEFREDNIIYGIKLIESINPSYISGVIKNTYGEPWFVKLCTEYKIPSFDSFSTLIYNKFQESAVYELTNRISDIRDLNYGKPKSTVPPLRLSKDELKKIFNTLLVNAIDYYLARPDVTLTTSFTTTTMESKDVIVQRTSPTADDTKIKFAKDAEAEGSNTYNIPTGEPVIVVIPPQVVVTPLVTEVATVPTITEPSVKIDINNLIPVGEPMLQTSMDITNPNVIIAPYVDPMAQGITQEMIISNGGLAAFGGVSDSRATYSTVTRGGATYSDGTRLINPTAIDTSLTKIETVIPTMPDIYSEVGGYVAPDLITDNNFRILDETSKFNINNIEQQLF